MSVTVTITVFWHMISIFNETNEKEENYEKRNRNKSLTMTTVFV